MPPEDLLSAQPCVLFEEEHVLVVSKPAGWNTHAPSPFAGEGIYDWLKHREPRWASLPNQSDSSMADRIDTSSMAVLLASVAS